MGDSLGDGLHGRVAVVTGAAGGIGRETAAALARAGAKVATVDRESTDAGQLAITVDLREPAAVEEAVERAGRELGPVYVLVNCAAVLVREPIDDVSEQSWETQVDVNLRVPFELSRAAAGRMRAAGAGGRIVNLVSQAWWTGGIDNSAVYAATKAGLVALTRNLARTLAADRILVNAIAPGAVGTPMFEEGLDMGSRAAFLAQIPLGRVADPAEIAAVAVFLASDHASYVTGATINVTGGQLVY
jgi:NAD(P)-dependent dehydrogenase (short-subunit alcohol dehydrogenase family)